MAGPVPWYEAMSKLREALRKVKRAYDSTVITKERAIELLMEEGASREQAEEILRT